MPERTKIHKVEKLVINLHDKKECFICVKNLNQASNHGLVLEKVHKVIKFNQKAWLKPHIDMNAELKKSKKWFWKRFFPVDEWFSCW